MKNKFIIPIIFFFIIISLFYLLIIDRDPSEVPSVLIEKKVPIFEASSLFNDEIFISNKELINETIILNFFATWCEPCRSEHKYLIDLFKKEKIKIIGINYKDDSSEAIKWLQELGNPYKDVISDSDGRIAIELGVYGIPETFIVNSKGIIKYRHLGPIIKNEYKDFIKELKKINE